MKNTVSPFKSMADVRTKNIETGRHFFDRQTMKFWKSRIETRLIDGRYFVTSEDEFAIDGRIPARIYAVRYAEDDGSMKTLKSMIRSKQSARDFISDEITRSRILEVSK